jgi:ABC-type transporter Mla subunit MlaD
MRRILWNAFVRAALFWLVVVGTIAAVDRWLGLDTPLVVERIGNGLRAFGAPPEEARAAVEALSDPHFAFALSGFLGACALGLLVAFLLLYRVWVGFSLWRARRVVTRLKSMPDFAAAYDDAVYPRLLNHPLIGHAWKEFDETLLKGGTVIGNTVRPSSFVNVGIARERLFGLKMMPSIPGYFVGVGLLLTFIGIVLALSKAGEATASGSSDAMQAAMADLLRIASFKFSTSIAGLGASIVLAFSFKVFTIGIERAFSAFNDAVEQRLRYTAPQSITAEMNEAMKEQRDELKAINSEQFFARMGQEISPQIQAAFTTAIAPVTESIAGAVDRLSTSSQTGVQDLIREFTAGVQGGAGAEMRALGETLQGLQATLADTQRGLGSSGEDFARRLSEAAENLNRLVNEASGRLGESAEQQRAGLAEAVSALRATFERANAKVDQDLGQSAASASAKVEAAMGKVMERLEGQLGSFMAGLGSFQEAMSGNVGETQAQIRAAQEGGVAMVAKASEEAARAIESGFAEALKRLNEEVSRLATALSQGAASMTHQAAAIENATGQTRLVSDAFAKTAQDARVAALPLAQSGEKIANATAAMTESLHSAAAGLAESEKAGRRLADTLTGHVETLTTAWTNYRERFERVDEVLAGTLTEIARAAESQNETLQKYATAVDKGLADAVTGLRPILEGLQDNAEEFAEHVQALERALSRRPAA